MVYKTRRQAKFRSRNDYNTQRQSPKAYPRPTTSVTRYPRYRAINSTGNVYRFKRAAFQNIPLNLAGGWNSNGFDMMLLPSLAGVLVSLSGTLVFSPTMPNTNEFTGLFDMYRIRYVDFELIFSNNESGVSNPGNMLPVIHIMDDYDSTGAQTLTDYQQHPELRSYQLGKEYTIRHRLIPKVKGDVLSNNFLTAVSGNLISQPWLRTDTPDVQMFGTRMYMDNLGRNGNVDVGTVLLKCTYTLEFKNVK